MFSNDIIHLLYQIQPFERNVPAPLLKVTNSEKFVFENLLMRIVTHEVHKPDGDIMPVIGNSLPVKQVQHPLQIGELVAPPASVQAVAPSVIFH